VSGEFGHQSFGTAKATPIAAAYKIPDYAYWNFGASYTYKALTFDLRYFATTLSKQSCFLITGTGQPASDRTAARLRSLEHCRGTSIWPV